MENSTQNQNSLENNPYPVLGPNPDPSVKSRPSASYSRKLVYPEKIKHNEFLKWCWKKVHFYKEDLIIGVSGPTGFGKTTLAVRLAELLDVDYEGKTRFKAYSMINGVKTPIPRLINSIETYKQLRKKTNWPIGTAFIIDEAQTIINSRDFMTRKNKDVIRLISTGRVFGAITFVVLPYWEHLDNQVKSYLHAVVKVHRPDRQNGISRYTPYRIIPTGYGKPPLTQFFVERDRLTGRRSKIRLCFARLPSKLLNLAQQEKTNSWKVLVHQGLISSSGGLISDEPVIKPRSVVNKEEKLKKVEEMIKTLSPIKEKFLNGIKYSAAKIRNHTGESREVCEMVAYRFSELRQLEKVG